MFCIVQSDSTNSCMQQQHLGAEHHKKSAAAAAAELQPDGLMRLNSRSDTACGKVAYITRRAT
jgi:hypothetical protein